jgi:hypothetical protein
MRLRPIVRGGLGLATFVAASTVVVAIGDQHWAAALVLAVLAIGCAFPAVTGRDPFDTRHRRRRHRRHRSRRHLGASEGAIDSPRATTPVQLQDGDHRA